MKCAVGAPSVWGVPILRERWHAGFSHIEFWACGTLGVLMLSVVLSERSAVWLAHLVWDQRVAGSNPAAPTDWSRDMIDDVRRDWSDPVIEAYKRDVDRTLLRENLKRTYDERFLTLKQMQRFSAHLQQAMREARRRS